MAYSSPAANGDGNQRKGLAQSGWRKGARGGWGWVREGRGSRGVWTAGQSGHLSGVRLSFPLLFAHLPLGTGHMPTVATGTCRLIDVMNRWTDRNSKSVTLCCQSSNALKTLKNIPKKGIWFLKITCHLTMVWILQRLCNSPLYNSRERFYILLFKPRGAI